MKKNECIKSDILVRYGLILLLFLFVRFLHAEGPRFSGIVESNAAAADVYNGNTAWLMEQYGNFRMDVDVSDNAEIHTAVNASAEADNRNELDTTGELERLYMSIYTEKADVEAGFMRIAFGYGQAFRPTDIFNPPNPLYPDARPKGALGGVVSLYPREGWKLQLFGADRTNPYVMYDDYNRPLAGLSGEVHTPEFSTQQLYAMQGPEKGEKDYFHYFGHSLKFDYAAGFAADLLYTYDGSGALTADELELEFAFGADYSFLKGDLYILAQYFYNGDGALQSDEELSDLYGTDSWKDIPVEQRFPLEGFADFYRKHYLFFSGTYAVDDYSRLTPSVLYAPEDGSLQPSLKAEHEPFQAMVLSITFRYPLGPETFGSDNNGELGPAHSGYQSSVTGSAQMRF